jgi:hypothetical protein
MDNVTQLSESYNIVSEFVISHERPKEPPEDKLWGQDCPRHLLTEKKKLERELDEISRLDAYQGDELEKSKWFDQKYGPIENDPLSAEKFAEKQAHIAERKAKQDAEHAAYLEKERLLQAEREAYLASKRLELEEKRDSHIPPDQRERRKAAIARHEGGRSQLYSLTANPAAVMLLGIAGYAIGGALLSAIKDRLSCGLAR